MYMAQSQIQSRFFFSHTDALSLYLALSMIWSCRYSLVIHTGSVNNKGILRIHAVTALEEGC